MQLRALVLCSVILPAVTPRGSLAQTDGEIAAWAAMMLTPVGAFAPMMVAPAVKSRVRLPTFAIRGGTWRLEGGKPAYTYGGSLVAPLLDKATLGVTVGYLKPGCPPGGGCSSTVMIGGDVESPVAERVLATSADRTVMNASLKGSAGWGRYLGPGGGNAFSVVGSVPISVRRETSTKGAFSAFLSPGFGYGSITDGGNPREHGYRPLLGGGIAWTAARGIGVHAGAQRVFIDGDQPTFWGLAVSFVPPNDIRRGR